MTIKKGGGGIDNDRRESEDENGPYHIKQKPIQRWGQHFYVRINVLLNTFMYE